jgi:hypothetical protein
MAKCEICNDTGKRLGSDYLDCSCPMAKRRQSIDEFVAQYHEANRKNDDYDSHFAVDRRARLECAAEFSAEIAALKAVALVRERRIANLEGQLQFSEEHGAAQRAHIDAIAERLGTDPRDKEQVVSVMEKIDGLKLQNQAQSDAQANEKDAARYRWLRMQDWFDGELYVLPDPKAVLTRGLGLGADCPSRERLDSAIDAAMQAQGGNHG